jgi:hypothetical protein
MDTKSSLTLKTVASPTSQEKTSEVASNFRMTVQDDEIDGIEIDCHGSTCVRWRAYSLVEYVERNVLAAAA